MAWPSWRWAVLELDVGAAWLCVFIGKGLVASGEGILRSCTMLEGLPLPGGWWLGLFFSGGFIGDEELWWFSGALLL